MNHDTRIKNAHPPLQITFIAKPLFYPGFWTRHWVLLLGEVKVKTHYTI